MNYPSEIYNFKHEYVKFFTRRFPFEIFKVLMKPHLDKKRYDYLLKEITEVVGVFFVLDNLVKKHKIKNFILYELASGDALFSHFVAKLFPDSRIFAVDLKFSSEYQKNGKSLYFDNLFFDQKNILEIDNLNKLDFIVSIHACTNLSEIVINIASKFSKFFILVPCCIGSNNYEKWKKENYLINKFFNIIKNEYYKWCFYLTQFAENKGFLVNLKKDNKMLSEKNIIIFGISKTLKSKM